MEVALPNRHPVSVRLGPRSELRSITGRLAETILWNGIDRLAEGGHGFDGDGATNLEELLAGTDPVDATSLLHRSCHHAHRDAPSLEHPTGGVINSKFPLMSVHGLILGTDWPWRLYSVSIVNDQGIAVYRVLRLR